MCTEGKCCWIELPQALFYYSIIEILLSLIWAIFAIIFLTSEESEIRREMEKNYVWDIGVYIIIGLKVLNLIFAIMLCVGCKKKKINLIKYYYYYGYLLIFVFAALLITTLAMGKWITAETFIGCLLWYLVFIIFLVRRALKQMETPPPQETFCSSFI